MMDSLTRPIYLLADSQLLFLEENNVRLLRAVRDSMESGQPKAAYFGASNGDNPDFYAIFVAAMEGLGIRRCRMIRSSLAEEDAGFLEQSDLILLAGGDVRRGWQALEQNGLTEILIRRYHEGATLMGVSAGAVQLGLLGWPEDAAPEPQELFDTLKLVPSIVSAHDEKNHWMALKRALRWAGGKTRGIGIPAGGGAAYYPDHRVVPLRRPLYEFLIEDGRVVGRVLPPGQAADI